MQLHSPPSVLTYRHLSPASEQTHSSPTLQHKPPLRIPFPYPCVDYNSEQRAHTTHISTSSRSHITFPGPTKRQAHSKPVPQPLHSTPEYKISPPILQYLQDNYFTPCRQATSTPTTAPALDTAPSPVPTPSCARISGQQHASSLRPRIYVPSKAVPALLTRASCPLRVAPCQPYPEKSICVASTKQTRFVGTAWWDLPERS